MNGVLKFKISLKLSVKLRIWRDLRRTAINPQLYDTNDEAPRRHLPILKTSHFFFVIHFFCNFSFPEYVSNFWSPLACIGVVQQSI